MASISGAQFVGKAATPVSQRALLTVAVMGATVMQILDATIANVALPHMQTSLGATLDQATWVLTSYIIAAAMAIPITGWLADRIGSRTLFLTAVTGFIIASMLCGIATSLNEMVAFRVLQGISGAFIGPLSQTVMLDINPPERHARAMSIWGMGIMIGPILGPVLGGWLTENYNWRWVFYVNVPVGIATLAVLYALLPQKTVIKRRFDHLGFWALAIGLASLQLLLDRGHQLDWFESWEIRIEIAIMIGAFWIFGVQMMTSKYPLFPKYLLLDRSFATSLLFMAVVGVVMFASMALLPPFLQNLFGYPVIDTGLLLAPRGVGILVSMWFAGRLMSKVDARLLVGIGLAIASFAAWQMTQWSLEMDWRPIALSGFVQGLGMGFVFIPLNVVAFATVSPEMRTNGSSLLNLFRSVGSSIGISVVTTLLARNIQTSHADIAGNVTNSSITGFNISSLQQYQIAGDMALSYVDAMVNKQAAMIAYLNDFYFVMWVSLLAVPLVLLLKNPKPGAMAGPPVME